LKLLYGIAFLIGLVAIAELLCDARFISPIILPPPHAIAAALSSQFTKGEVWAPLGATIAHLGIGWTAACVLGIAGGALVGLTSFGRAYVAPTLQFLRPLPASAFAPVAILLIGRGNLMIVAVIVGGAIWPVLLSSLHGFAAIEPRLTEVTRALKLSRSQAFWMIALPSATPDIIAGARVSISIALILAVVGEILASYGGLGDMLNIAERSYRAADLYAGVVLVGLLGVVTNTALERAERYLLRWRPAPTQF
jgi:sulfonate transport system permease protein